MNKKTPAERRRRFDVGINHYAYARVIELLVEGTRSMKEIAAEIGCTPETVARFCAALHRVKMVHVVAWEQDGRGRWSIRVYMLGRGNDVKPPPPKSRAVAEAERRARRKMEALLGIVKQPMETAE